MADTKWTDAAILLLLVGGALWSATEFGQLSGQQTTTNIAFVYVWLSFFPFVCLFFAGSAFIRFVGLNKTGKDLAINGAMGGILGYLATGVAHIQLAITPPIEAAAGATASIDPLLSGVYVNLIAPFAEEYAFRGALFPSLEMFFQSRGHTGFLATAEAAIASSLGFVVFHLVAYNGDVSSLGLLFIFALAECALVKATNSLAPAIGAHFVLNLINGGM